MKSALRAAPDLADAHYTLGQITEMRGGTGAEAMFRRARRLDPERYPPVSFMSHEAFDAVVAEALAELPERVKDAIANIPVLVEELPTLEDLRQASPPLSPASLGMFVGAAPDRLSVLDPNEEQ